MRVGKSPGGSSCAKESVGPAAANTTLPASSPKRGLLLVPNARPCGPACRPTGAHQLPREVR